MKKIRCAVYCRKSSEEGLEQEFNSLHAQREACAAYIASQKHEGWELVPEIYDDGGFSGGNMERPALKKLLEDIGQGFVNVIVVYKIDRLSRSIADFMKMVEVFDKHKVAFVSVTQSFNTQNSMGKLMLNILLSFAQFEREVTGERIRDKIAASKKKGMWMGGTVPLGYTVKERKLLIDPDEAETVKYIFNRYLELETVNLLKEDLDTKGFTSKSRDGVIRKFSKGHIYTILKNRLYIGEINHKDKSYPGEHQGIIDIKIFDQVQKCMGESRVTRSNAIGAKSPCLLSGRLFDDNGNSMTPKHARGGRKHYRYYTSQAIIRSEHANAGSMPNIPASEIEFVVKDEITKFLKDDDQIQGVVENYSVAEQGSLIKTAKQIAGLLEFSDAHTQRVLIRSLLIKATLSNMDVEIHLSQDNLIKILNDSNQISLEIKSGEAIIIKREIKLAAARSGSKVVTGRIASGCNMSLVRAIAKSFLWNEQLITGERKSQIEIQKAERIKSISYVEKIIRLRFLPPHVVESIIMGTHSQDLTVNNLFIQLADSK